MATEIAAGKVGQRHRDHDRDRAAERGLRLKRRHDRRLAVQRIEHRLDQDEVDPALDKRFDLFAVDGLHFVEGHFAETGIADVGGERQGLVGRPHRAGDPALLAVGVGDRPRDPRRSDVDVADQRGGILSVIGLADPVGVERVGRQHVGACVGEALADPADDVGAGEVEQVVIAALVGDEPEVAAVIGQLLGLDHRAVSAVLDEDTAGGGGAEGGGGAHLARTPSRWQMA